MWTSAKVLLQQQDLLLNINTKYDAKNVSLTCFVTEDGIWCAKNILMGENYSSCSVDVGLSPRIGRLHIARTTAFCPS